jgi:hypothetical protein
MRPAALSSNHFLPLRLQVRAGGRHRPVVAETHGVLPRERLPRPPHISPRLPGLRRECGVHAQSPSVEAGSLVEARARRVTVDSARRGRSLLDRSAARLPGSIPVSLRFFLHPCPIFLFPAACFPDSFPMLSCFFFFLFCTLISTLILFVVGSPARLLQEGSSPS